jgi:hypothetical protein
MEKSKQRAVDPDDHKQHSPNGNLFKKFRKFYEFPAGGAFFFELLLILPAIRVSIRRDEAGRFGQDRGATSRKAGHPDQVREKACP